MELALSLPATARPADPPSERVTDADLLGRIAARDRSAFEALYQRYARPLFGLALRMLGDRGRAEDAVQEAFTSVWRSASNYRPERGPAAPWLYAVARNAIVDRARARARAGRRGARHAVGRARAVGAGRSRLSSPGASIAPWRSCLRRSARRSSSPTGAASRRAKWRATSASRSGP